MSTGQHSGVMGTVREMAPALTGNPLAVWHAARVGTQAAADALPDRLGLGRVKAFVKHHPVLAAGAAAAAGYYLLGGTRLASLSGRLLRRALR